MAAAAVMLTLWLLLVLISVAPQLHELLHHGSQNGRHECVVTQVSKGGLILTNTPRALMVALPIVPKAQPVSEPVYVPASGYKLAPSRAPPTIPALTGLEA